MWDFLIRKRQPGRVILLCTHYFDEAETLGDQVLILANGSLRAAGKPSAIQRDFGSGYTVQMTVDTEVAAALVASIHNFSSDIYVTVAQANSQNASVVTSHYLTNASVKNSAFFSHISRHFSLKSIELRAGRLTEAFSNAVKQLPASVESLSSTLALPPCSPSAQTKTSWLHLTLAIVNKRMYMYVRWLVGSITASVTPVAIVGCALILNSTSSSDAQLNPVTTVLVSVFIGIAFMFVPQSILFIYTQERHSRHRFLLYTAGMSSSSYWVGNFLWDTLETLCIPVFITIILFSVISTGGNLPVGPIAALLLTFIPSVVAFTTLNSILFTSEAVSKLVLVVANPILGLMLSALTGTIRRPSTALTTLFWIMRLLPSFNLGQGLISVPISIAKKESVWEWNNVGYSLVIMTALCPIYLALTIVIDEATYLGRMKKCCAVENTEVPTRGRADDDVAEALRIERVSNDVTEALRIERAAMQYKGSARLAVDRASLSCQKASGEILSLLGKNGSGKTTLLSMVVGEVQPTAGSVSLFGYSTRTHLRTATRYLGYCPQFDALVETLTVRDHITLFTKVKGISSELGLMGYVEAWIRIMEFGRYADMPANTLSGGWKRRLSLTLALLGTRCSLTHCTNKRNELTHCSLIHPLIHSLIDSLTYTLTHSHTHSRTHSLTHSLFHSLTHLFHSFTHLLILSPTHSLRPLLLLDEPTCSMDPVTRTQMWKVIRAVAQCSSVLITTHLMEEAQALCTRLGVMV
jgi:ABC-type multidrug transport system ATPase subunit